MLSRWAPTTCKRAALRFTGIAYPKIRKNSGGARTISGRFDTERQFYHEKGHALHEDEFGPDDVTGRPIQIEHAGNETEVGQVFRASMTKDRKLRVYGVIWTDTPEGAAVAERVRRGDLSGLSIHYETCYDPSTLNVHGKRIVEVSLCKTPFFAGCTVELAASKQAPYKCPVPTHETLMEAPAAAAAPAKTTASTEPAAASSPQAAESTESPQAEMLRTIQVLTEELRAAKERTVAQAKELERLGPIEAKVRAEEEQKLAEWRNQQAEKLKEVLSHIEQVSGTKPSDDLQKLLGAAFTDPKQGEFQTAQLACSKAWVAKTQENAELQKRVQALESREAALRQAIQATRDVQLLNSPADEIRRQNSRRETQYVEPPKEISFGKLFNPVTTLPAHVPQAAATSLAQQAPAAVATVAASAEPPAPEYRGPTYSLRGLNQNEWGQMMGIQDAMVRRMAHSSNISCTLEPGK